MTDNFSHSGGGPRYCDFESDRIYRQVLAVYQQTPECIEKQAVLDSLQTATQSCARPSEAHPLIIPAEVRVLWAFITRIAEDGEPGHRVSFDDFAVGAIDTKFKRWLRLLAIQDDRWGHYRRVWNSLCDEQRCPEMKSFRPFVQVPDVANDLPF